jgi:crotonobetainyl-CoA:carnitine CoA-transferase CaiB-like acyl-CoA transferase
VNSVEEALRDPRVAENELVLEMEHPELGTIREIASPIKVGGVKTNHRLAPRLGEHTDQVLRDLVSATDDEIASWREGGVL